MEHIDEIDQFIGEDEVEPTLTDYIVDEEGTENFSNPPSTRNLAATLSLIKDGPDIEEDFRAAVNELGLEEAVAGDNQILQEAQAIDAEANKTTVVDMIQSNQLDPDLKLMLAGNFTADRANSSAESLLATKGLTDASKGESYEASWVRLDAASMIDGVLHWQKVQQEILNSEALKADKGLWNTVIDMAEMVLPFAEQGAIAAISREIKELSGDEDLSGFIGSILLMGSSKEALSNMLPKLPIHKKEKFSRLVLEVLTKHKGLIFSSSNDFAHMEILRTMIQEGHYTNTSKWVDNIISLLDATIVGGYLTKLLRGTTTLGKMAKAQALTAAARAETLAEVGELNKLQVLRESVVRGDKTNIIPGRPSIEEANERLRAARESGRPIEPSPLTPERPNLADANARIKAERAATKGNEVAHVTTTKTNAKGEINIITSAVSDTDRANDLIRAARRNSVRSDVQPGSVSRVVNETNPQKFAGIYKASTVSDELAHATHGTNNTEAAVDGLTLEIFNRSDESVRYKTHNPDVELVDELPTKGTIDFSKQKSGMIYFFDSEKTAMRIEQETNLLEAINVESRAAMYQFDNADDGFRVRTVIGPKQGGYLHAQKALDLAEQTFAERGITRANMVLLKRGPQGYKPVPIDYDLPGDFMVGIDYNYKFVASDLKVIGNADVKNNLLDFIPAIGGGAHGTLARMVLDPASMLHPVITLGANRAVDVAFGLEKEMKDLGKRWAKRFAKLDGTRRDFVANQIYKANAKSEAFNHTSLKALGATDSEVELLMDWASIWDIVYRLENMDYTKTLRNRGYRKYIHTVSDSAYFVRPIARNKIVDDISVYDSATNTIIVKTQDDLTKLYAEGGTVAELKDSFKVGEGLAEYIISNEKTGSDFIRGIKEGEKVLHYRPGYYSVRYKDAKFIVKVYNDKNGNPLKDVRNRDKEVAVATARNHSDASTIKQRLEVTTHPEDNVTFYIRGDVKNNGFNDNYGLSLSQGRSSQRRRGELLEDASSTSTNPVQTHIQDPIEALTQSIRSITKRVSMRDYLEATKARFLIQYADVIKSDRFGNPILPSNLGEIGKPGRKVGTFANRQVADARTTFEYIQYLERGYVDAIDDFMKATMNTLAENLGQAGTRLGEDAARVASNFSPNSILRTTAFNLYIALNPLRQLVVQSHQGVRLLAINPKYMLDPRGMGADLAVVVEGHLRGGKVSKASARMAGKTVREAEEMFEDLRLSGLGASVDSNNIVRVSHARLADFSHFQRLKSTIGLLPKGAQKVGFDIGEMTNLYSAWLSFRNQALRANKGKGLSPAQLDMVGAEARNFTYNMNFAGDTPYNQNFLRGVFQFIQVPHKALLNNITNRAISPSVRRKTLLFDTLMFGTGTGIGNYVLQSMDIQDPELRNVIENGIEDVALNGLLSAMFGYNIQIDFSSLAPGNIHGMSNMLWELAGERNLWEIIANTPGGQPFFGHNPRITNSIMDGLRLIGVVNDPGTDIVSMMQVMKGFAMNASGVSNAFKSLYAIEMEKAINSKEEEVDEHVNVIEAVAIAFGLGTKDSRKMWQTSRELYYKSSAAISDAKLAADLRIRILTSQGLSKEEIMLRAVQDNEFFRVFSPQQKAIYIGRIGKVGQTKQNQMNVAITKAMNLITPDQFEQIVRNAPIDNPAWRDLLINFAQTSRDLYKDTRE